MEYDATKLDEVVLALLHFNAHTDHGITRAWKGFDWDSLDRLHARGFISDPKSKAKSVVLTEEGARVAEELPRRTPMADKPQDTPLSMEPTMIRKALEQAHRDKALAAKLLGISQTELQRRMQVYGLTMDGLPEE